MVSRVRSFTSPASCSGLHTILVGYQYTYSNHNTSLSNIYSARTTPRIACTPLCRPSLRSAADLVPHLADAGQTRAADDRRYCATDTVHTSTLRVIPGPCSRRTSRNPLSPIALVQLPCPFFNLQHKTKKSSNPYYSYYLLTSEEQNL
jgi:hypothetical protein